VETRNEFPHAEKNITMATNSLADIDFVIMMASSGVILNSS
jgi:hypothetical protein